MKDTIKLNYEIKDYDVYDTHQDHAIVRAKIVNVGRNHNDTSFSKESIEKAIPTLYNIPLIGIYSEIENDFKSHAKNDLERKQTYAIGTIPESCNAHFEKDLMGMEYLVADIVVWKEYFPEFFNVIANNEEKEKQTTISMEIKLLDYEKVDGIFDITEFAFNGICLLGENVRPGIPNAGLRVIRFEEGKIDFEDNNLYQNLLKESNEELEILSKYSEKALSVDNGKINKKFKKGEVGNMAEKKEALAENLEEVVKEEKVDPTQAEAKKEGAFEDKKEEKAPEDGETKKEEKPEEKEEAKEKAEDMEKVEDKENNCGTNMEKKEDCICEEKEEMADKEKCEEVKEEKCEAKEEEAEEKPLSKAERKTYQANEKAYQEKIAYLKGELAAYKPYKAMYEQAEKEIKELLEYKEEAELNKLEREKSEYFKSFGATQFDEEDRDEIIKKINDYSFSYQDFKAFMADKVQKYGMKTRFQNITEVINMYSESPDIASKYAEAEVVSDEDKILDRYTNI